MNTPVAKWYVCIINHIDNHSEIRVMFTNLAIVWGPFGAPHSRGARLRRSRWVALSLGVALYLGSLGLSVNGGCRKKGWEGLFWEWFVGLFLKMIGWGLLNFGIGRFCWMKIVYYLFPEDPCMEYLPTLTPKVISNNPNVGKYTIHGSLGIDYITI